MSGFDPRGWGTGLGYSLIHSFGAVSDNPDLVVACVVGDGEAETGPLATAWHANKFIDPVTDGAVLPILRLNGCGGCVAGDRGKSEAVGGSGHEGCTIYLCPFDASLI